MQVRCAERGGARRITSSKPVWATTHLKKKERRKWKSSQTVKAERWAL